TRCPHEGRALPRHGQPARRLRAGVLGLLDRRAPARRDVERETGSRRCSRRPPPTTPRVAPASGSPPPEPAALRPRRGSASRWRSGSEPSAPGWESARVELPRSAGERRSDPPSRHCVLFLGDLRLAGLRRLRVSPLLPFNVLKAALELTRLRLRDC